MIINKFIFLLFLLFSCFSLSNDIYDESDVCDSGETFIIFFNGVYTTEKEARSSLDKLKKVYGNKDYKGRSIKYDVLYNQTNGLNDLVEVFEQRMIEQHIALVNRYELFFKLIDRVPGWVDKVAGTILAVENVFRRFNEDLRTVAVSNLVSWRSNPITVHDYNEHKNRIDGLVLEGKKLLFIAHSQGNLFANEAYRYAITKTSPNSIKLVHVAPASVLTYGSHVLVDQDLVINGLRAIGPVPSNTDYIPIFNPFKRNYGRDFLGHGFVTTYLNEELSLRGRVFGHIEAAFNSLEPPEALAESGFFTVILTWDGDGDVDLHVFEPTGKQVYYRDKEGDSGFLDYDNVEGFGPEHYFASCDRNKLKTGIYQVKLANYSKANGRIATVQIASNKQGVLGTRSVLLGEATGQNPVYDVFNVSVAKDEDSGKYTVLVE